MIGHAIGDRLQRAHRVDAGGEIGHLARHRERGVLRERRERRLHRLALQVEVLPQPGARRLDVGLERALVACEQRESRRKQAQSQVLSQEKRLLRRHERRRRPVGDFDANDAAQVVPDVAQEAHPCRLACRIRAIAS